MTNISGENWFGIIHTNSSDIITVMGRIFGHAWYFKSTAHAWFIEISEDQAIEPNDLPLVGYGCSGWLYEKKIGLTADNNTKRIQIIDENINHVFDLFKQKKLNYLPTVTCGCSD